MTRVIIKLINIYKIVLSPSLEILFGKGCVYYPTCSEYAIDALKKYGPAKGIYLSLRRLVSCTARSRRPHIDPV